MLAWCTNCQHAQEGKRVCLDCRWTYAGKSTFKRKNNNFKAKDKDGLSPEQYFAKVIPIVKDMTM